MNRLHAVLVMFIISVAIAYFTPNITNTDLLSSHYTEPSFQSSPSSSAQELEQTAKRRAAMKRLRTEAHLNMHHAQKKNPLMKE